MKQNRDYHGGANTLRFEPPVLNAYARYLAEYVQAYHRAGVPVYAVHIQNEPASMQNFPSCCWTGPQERDFVRDYLGPQFRADHVQAQIWLGTINNGDMANYADFPSCPTPRQPLLFPVSATSGQAKTPSARRMTSSHGTG